MATLRIAYAIARCVALLPVAFALDVRKHVMGKHSPTSMGGQEFVW
jgi:hypothetical protein